MGKKRKSELTGLEEVDKGMYTTFCSAANSLSQLYTQAQAQQKLAFHAGERYGLETLYQWILRHHEDGSRVTAADIFAYLQNELDYTGGESASPSSQFHQQSSQPQALYGNSGVFGCAGTLGQMHLSQAARPAHPDQQKNSVFSNALSSPVRRSLQPYQLAQAGYYNNTTSQPGNGGRRAGSSLDSGHQEAFNAMHPQNHDIDGGVSSGRFSEDNHNQSREAQYCNSNDTSMDIHEEGPPHQSY